MRTERISNLVLSSLLLLATLSQDLFAKEDRRAQKPTNSSPSGLILDYKPVFNVNEVEGWIANDARLFQTSRDNAGFFWPAGSGKSAIFAMAPWLACRFEGQEGFGGLRTAAVQNIGRNGTEFRPGRIIRTAAGVLQPDDQTKPEYRLYVIRSGDNENTNPDYRDWPYEQGAPYKTLLTLNRLADSFAVAPNQVIPGVTPPIGIDKRTGDPILPESGETLSQYVTRVRDRLEPKLIGAVSAWCVYNDMVPGTRRFSAQPMRCEIQQYAFAFATSGPIGRAVFFKFRVINRNIPNPANPSSGLWKDTYFAIWNDNDLGDASDDLVGVDTLRSLAYCYNANNNDPVYGAAPPAVGVDYFQGPFKRKNVPFTGTPRPVELDTATTIPLPGGGTIPNPRLNQPATLGASAHVRFDNAGGPIGDPETNRPDHVYNFMRGLDKNGNPLGNTEPGSNFMFPGDPETGQGIIETQPADKRQLIVTGPFDVYAGEEQLIVVGVHIAKGTNNLNSVTRLRNENNAIQDLFNANFQAPQPPAPKVQVTTLEREIILNWVDDNPRSQSFTRALENVPLARPGADTIANPNDKYFFEGYNVYQFELIEGRSIPTSRIVKIATFDKINNIASVLDFDPRRTDALGRPIVDITQAGNNSGIQRSLRITEDAVRGGALVKGRRYFFAVTSYFVNPYLLTKNPYPNPVTGIIEREGSAALESLERIFEVVPQDLSSGTVLPAQSGDRVETDRFARLGDDNVKIQVENPAQLQNRRIKVKIANVQGRRWELRDANTDTLLYPRAVDPVDSLNVLRLTSEGQYSPDSLADFERRADAAIFGGLRVIVKQNLLGVKRDGQLGAPPVVYSPANNKWFLPKAVSYDTTRAGASAGVLSSNATNFNLNGISDGGTVCYPRVDIFGQTGQGTLLPADSLLPIAIVFQGNDTTQWTRAYRYVLNIQRFPPVGTNFSLVVADTSYRRFIDTSSTPLFPGGPSVAKSARVNVNGPYQDRRRIPVQAFKMRPRSNGGFSYERVNLLFTERNETKALGFDVNGRWEPSTATHGGQEILYVMNSPYRENEDTLRYVVGLANNQPRFLVTQSSQLDIAYALWIRQESGKNYRQGDTLIIYPNYRLTPQTEYVIETQAPRFERRVAEDRIAKINVFPNPYLGSSGRERFLRQTFVTFTNLPQKCKIRIFTLNGDLVRVIERDNPNSSLEDWNLRNSANIPVASGMYLVHIETEFGNKILKLGVIMRQEREDFF